MARVELVMPKMGESIMEATILKWRKKIGESVELDEPILDIATDKVDSEIPSPVAGVLVEILFQENDVVAINKAIAILETDASSASVAPQQAAGSGSAQATKADSIPQTAEIPYVPAGSAATNAALSNSEGRFYSPLVRTIAKQEGIAQGELDALSGSGQEGRVTKKDILAYVANRGTSHQSPATNQPATSQPVTNQPITNQPINPWGISENTRPVFSDDGSKLYFGVAPPPILNDTMLLKEEIVEVEVWAWNDKRLYTQEKNRLENEKKRFYPVVWHTGQNRFVALGSPELPELRFQEQRNANLALGITEEPYTSYITSEGTAHKDLVAVNLETGDKRTIIKDLRCNPRLSPSAKYVTWWSDPDTAWFAWNASTSTIARLTDNRTVPFFNEENDVPDYPSEHGLAAWLEGDEAMLVYDKYDIWRIDPDGKKKPQCLTTGRESKTTFRYIKLDPEERSIRYNAPLLLHKFNDVTKSEGYTWLNLPRENFTKPGMLVPFIKDNWEDGFAYTRNVLKARYEDVFLYSKENYQTFPNLIYATGGQSEKLISDANPQQSEYKWGSIEMVEWTSLTGEKIKGLLVKPEGFDPKKQYPMLVNFYEKLSDELFRHRAPDFHRSQINYTFYASRGYLVFAPDIPYRIGYPGESAYDAIMSGVTALISKGFVDPKRVALQGHSWGGYQSAYLVTRTNLFACAEAGAPVANMTSAYGGIRWESGLNRAFQYEHQQSRIGGSLWEKPKQYIENSPLFALDKVETPLLILHNDKDGAVPWYQGIELFTGLRRLDKPAWLLNYNDEPHWPVKIQNRVDFQKRMQQFFDYYLMAAPEPSWMKRGVPPMEKGILQGY